MGVPRMRTIQQCAAYLKEQDPETGIGEWRIRQMVNQTEIPAYRAGKRILINLDTLLDYIGGGGPVAGGQEKGPI